MIDILYIAAGKILCRPYYCCYCGRQKDDAVKEAKNGPEAFLRAVVAYDGMICGCSEWMTDTAREALADYTKSVSSSTKAG